MQRPSDDGDIALCSNGDVLGEVCLGVGRSHTLCDFLCMTSCDSVIMLCRSRRLQYMGGELGGVVRFWMEPGGELFGVRIWLRETGEVLRASGETGVASGETGVGRRLGVLGLIILDTRFLNDSLRAGEEECLGEGVLEEEWLAVSTLFRSFPRIRLKNEGLFLILPLPLERCRNSFPTLCPRVGRRLVLSLRMLVSSRGIVFTCR